MAFRSLDRVSRLGFSPGRRPLPIIGRRDNLVRFYTSTNLPGVDRSYGFGLTKSLVGLTMAAVSLTTTGYLLGRTRSSEPNIDLNSTAPLGTGQLPRYQPKAGEKEVLIQEFIAIVGEENVSTTQGDLTSHSTSDWSSHPGDPSHKPFCIIYPASTEEVSKIMKVCHKYRTPVTGYSGGTSLEGHFEPTRGGVCIDFGHMDKILALHKEDLDVIVQPAVGWQELNDQLAQDNLFFPPDPGPGAMIGGMVGTGCSGTNAYRYGTMREWVLSLTVVLADGTVVKTRQRPRKSSAGYDLTRVFIGSEGTLGLVTEATLKLTILPQNESVAVCSFKSVRDAAHCVSEVVSNSVPVAAVEILNEDCMRLINEVGATSRDWTPAPTLFFKFNGTKGDVQQQIKQVQSLAQSSGSLSFDFAEGEDEREELWSARHQALWSLTSTKNEDDHVWTTDVAVPVSQLPEAIEKAQSELKESGLKGVIVGHVGDGNFHTFLLYNDRQRKVAEDFVHRMVDRALEMEGTATGEHGVGLVKRDYLPKELGVDTVSAMRKMKQAFDPLCILNCDKVIRMQKASAEDM
ncbi:D-lactate dehydrogenase [Fusarium oxysporum f. sp. raphani]|uniref:D-lactate dehydrogenase (cytochrome) n=1 Tax=Fusarium oxysporum f. sp. raphani TaxID=96318 RepID=A0A8J5P944_FUSOX|nr:D-lactate dehydrogenase [Fusarium oxysporum f. sp. raphani]